MPDLDLFQKALALEDPWQVVESNFDPDSRRLDLVIDFPRGSRFPCPECDETGCPVHDTTQKSWRHLDFFQHQAYLSARVPRITCPRERRWAEGFGSRQPVPLPLYRVIDPLA